jgi:hypothetical protein
MTIAATLRQMAAPEATVKSEIHMGFSLIALFRPARSSCDSPPTPIPTERSVTFCMQRGKTIPKSCQSEPDWRGDPTPMVASYRPCHCGCQVFGLPDGSAPARGCPGERDCHKTRLRPRPPSVRTGAQARPVARRRRRARGHLGGVPRTDREGSDRKPEEEGPAG